MSQQQADGELVKLYELVQGHLKTMREVQSKRTRQIEHHHQLESQRNENTLVKQELQHLEPGATVFKLIGPALVAQDQNDANTIVDRRLEHISTELKRVDAMIDDLEKQEDKEREKILDIQKKMQARQAQLQAAQAAPK